MLAALLLNMQGLIIRPPPALRPGLRTCSPTSARTATPVSLDQFQRQFDDLQQPLLSGPALSEAERAAEDFDNFRAADAQKVFRQTPRAVRRAPQAVMEAEAEEAPAEAAPTAQTAAASLEDKMAGWEASAEEQRANTLGGNLPLVGMPGLPGRMTRTDQPKGGKVDGFDIGMTISAVILVPLTLAVFAFPFMMGSIDINSVGPPPTG